MCVGAQEGVVSSGNSLDCSPEDMSQLHANEAAVKEMEAAGISWVCSWWVLEL